MYAVEFETDVVSEYVRIPNFEQFKNQHVKVIVLSESSQSMNLKPLAQSRRQPASVPPIHFKGDVISSVPANDWDLS
jgi:hypothetical protein